MNRITIKSNHKNTKLKRFDDSIDSEKFAKSIKLASLYSIPTSLLISASICANLIAKQIMAQTDYLFEFIYFFILSMLMLSVPITISIYKQYKHKGWIIFLALCCFLPFGAVMYLISLIWSIVISFQKNSQER